MKTDKVSLGRWESCSELCSVDSDIAKDPSITQNLSIDGSHLTPRVSGAASGIEGIVRNSLCALRVNRDSAAEVRLTPLGKLTKTQCPFGALCSQIKYTITNPAASATISMITPALLRW
jgi:hypothetical protein